MKKQSKIQGLGDIIAVITHFFFIDKLAKKIANLFGEEDCGCDRRRDKLNKAVPFSKKK
jgi:hypothetical protein